MGSNPPVQRLSPEDKSAIEPVSNTLVSIDSVSRGALRYRWLAGVSNESSKSLPADGLGCSGPELTVAAMFPRYRRRPTSWVLHLAGSGIPMKCCWTGKFHGPKIVNIQSLCGCGKLVPPTNGLLLYCCAYISGVLGRDGAMDLLQMKWSFRDECWWMLSNLTFSRSKLQLIVWFAVVALQRSRESLVNPKHASVDPLSGHFSVAKGPPR